MGKDKLNTKRNAGTTFADVLAQSQLKTPNALLFNFSPGKTYAVRVHLVGEGQATNLALCREVSAGRVIFIGRYESEAEKTAIWQAGIPKDQVDFHNDFYDLGRVIGYDLVRAPDGKFVSWNRDLRRAKI